MSELRNLRQHHTAMGERQNTIVCIFDMRSPRITAFNIYEWIHEQLRLQEDNIRMIQIDGPRRRVYIKFVSADRMQSILQDIEGQQKYKHDNGEISIVKVELAGMGVRRVRVAGLPPEVKKPVLRDVMSKYGNMKDIQEEQWPNQYRYKVSNGIKIVGVNLKKHVPSHMFIAGHRVLTTYEGQPPTCYNCNEQGHHSVECPYRGSSTPT